MDIFISSLLLESIFDFGIWNENVYISILIFFLKSFGPYLKKWKNWFPNVFSKSDLAGVGYIFMLKIFLKKPNFLKYAHVLVVACRKLKSNSARWPPYY